MHLREDAERELARYFSELPEEVLRQEEFANGRFVRNLFERTKSKAALRAELYGNDGLMICPADFRPAMSRDIAQLNQREVKKYPMGFRLRDL